jgi:ADP-ribose pyrophosphatase
MKKGKVVHRIPKDHYMVSKRNRVFIDKKKEASANACREKVNIEEEFCMLEKKLLHDCNIFNVVELPPDPSLSKRKTSKFWVEHKPTVCIVPLNPEGLFIFIEQFRWPAMRGVTEFPAGSMDDGESPMEAANRELAEEIGFRAHTLIKLFEGYLSPGYSNEYMYFYLAKDLYYSPLPCDEGEEDIKKHTLSFSEAITLAANGENIDAKTMLALMLSEKYLSLEGNIK